MYAEMCERPLRPGDDYGKYKNQMGKAGGMDAGHDYDMENFSEV